MDEQDWEAKLSGVAELSWRESALYAATQDGIGKEFEKMVHACFVEAYKRGAKDTMLTLKAMQAIDVTGKAG